MPSLRNVCAGLVAGLAGSAAMHAFRLLWEASISSDSRHTIFGFDREADINAARRAYAFFSNDALAEKPAEQLGIAMHYGLGATFGVLYVLSPATRFSSAAVGALLWIFADEIPISLAGISDPSAKSVASHGSALASHLLFGFAVNRTVRILDPAHISTMGA